MGNSDEKPAQVEFPVFTGAQPTVQYTVPEQYDQAFNTYYNIQDKPNSTSYYKHVDIQDTGENSYTIYIIIGVAILAFMLLR